MTDQTQASADGQTTTDAGTQQSAATHNADTTALTEGGNKQTEAENTALTGDDKAKEGEGKQPEAESAETKTEDDKSKSQVPDKYEFKAPESVQLDETMVGQFSEVAKELGMSQEQAQKLVDKMAPVIQNRAVESVKAARAEWKAQQATDTVFGGEKLAENLGVARKAMQAFGDEELTVLLNQSGIGDHPAVIRAFFKAGKAISEDSFVSAKAGKPAGDAASVMFPSMNKSA